MGLSPPLLSFLALGIVFATWGVYLSTIPKNTVPAKLLPSVALQTLGAASAVFAMVRQPSVTVIVPSAMALMMASLFLYLLSQRKTPIGKITVAVGESLPPLSLQTIDGGNFESASLAGKRVLLKFFRGSW